MAPIRVHSPIHAPHRVPIGVRADSGRTTNNNNGSPAVSPPLVVVVVAIGLFSLTMFSMFGRRLLELGGRSRYPAAQTGAHDDRRLFLSQALGLAHTGRLQREEPPAGTKPRLWDIQIENQIHAKPRQRPSSLSWNEIMPLAVTVSEEERCSVAEPIRPAPHALTRRPTDRRLCRLFRWLCLSCRRRRPTQTGQAVRDEQPSPVDGNATPSLLPRKNLQVVVAIAMPCRPRQAVYPFDMESRRTVDVDYSIGLYTCSWQREAM